MKNHLRSAVGRALVSSGLHRVVLRTKGVIVAFHRVTDALPEDGITRSSRDFVRFCEFFRQYFDVLSLSDFVGRVRSGESVGGTIAITFDDGYLDNFEIAAPILQRFGLPATFFVTTGMIGTTDVLPWDTELPRHPGWMTWDHVRGLVQQGFDIGAHTRTHVDLGRVNGVIAEQEIIGSRQDLLDQIGRAPAHFAFPFGRPDNLLEENRRRIIAAGFESCASCHGGTTGRGADPFRLYRFGISPWFRTPEQFMFEVLRQPSPNGHTP